MKYSSYSSFPDFWLQEIPEHWRTKKMKRLFDERSEKGFPDEPLLVAAQNMGVVPKAVYGNRTVEAQKDLHLLKLVRIGDFVISLRSFQGGLEYAYYQGIISPAYTILIPREPISPGYFRYLAKCKLFIGLLQQCVTGIREGQNIDYGKLCDHILPIPPRSEQDQIVRYLDWQVSKINQLIAAKKREIEVNKELLLSKIDALMRYGINNKSQKQVEVMWLGSIETGAQIERLGNYAKRVYTGSTPKNINEEHFSDEFDWYTPSDFSDDLKLGKSMRRLSILGKSMVKSFPANSVLMIGIGGTMGKVAISSHAFSCNQQINVIICSPKILPEYLAYYLRAYRTHIFNTAKYTTLPILNQQETKNIPIIYRDLEEQKIIVAEIKTFASLIDRANEMITSSISLLHELRTRLISDVVTGQIDVRGIEVPEFEYVEENIDEENEIDEGTNGEAGEE